MSPHYFFGVDPGLSGGVAVVHQDGNLRTKFPMPLRDDRTIDSRQLALRATAGLHWTSHYPNVFFALVVEKVWAMPGQGVVSMFNFGRATGQAIGALETFIGTRALEVAPQTWQKALWGAAEDPKAAAREYCAKTWPNESFLATARSKKPHQGMVDAACLAAYGRRNWKALTS